MIGFDNIISVFPFVKDLSMLKLPPPFMFRSTNVCVGGGALTTGKLGIGEKKGERGVGAP